MAKAKIMVVEDEAITAKDLQMTLQDLEYEVPAVAFTGEEAVQKAGEHKPDLVLMDIVLLDKMDGMEAAEQIRTKFDIPVVYLTAYADEEILERAKVTEPYGYIVKPFSDKELRSNIEVALYKHGREKKVRENLDICERFNKLLVQSNLQMHQIKEDNKQFKKRIEELEQRCQGA